jgi:fructan beta-fructosidase
MKIKKHFLFLPVKNGVAKRWLFLKSGSRILREFDIELPPELFETSGAISQCDFWTILDVSAWIDQELTWSVDTPDSNINLDHLPQADSIQQMPGLADPLLYREKYRPQFHFSPRRGWMNDPNGLVHFQGVYHLFFQHNPYGINWGNMHWGHAISRDLLHWQELGDAIYPNLNGTIFSGSGVVDWHNNAGLQQNGQPVLIFFYTAAGNQHPSSMGKLFSQCMAYSLDGGINCLDYTQNPVITHIIEENRDPKVTWYAQGNSWIMALYKHEDIFALFKSQNLKTWTHLQDLSMPGCSECPDFFELPVEGEPDQQRWVFTSANGRYMLGKFDGRQFTPETGPLQVDYGTNYYAVQTYSDTPDNRRIQLAWMASGSYPEMPFNQQMSFPCELKLRSFPEGLRLCRLPVKEIADLHRQVITRQEILLRTGAGLLTSLAGDLYDITLEINLCCSQEFHLLIRGQRLSFSSIEKTFTCIDRTAPLDLHGKPLRLHILIDRTSMETFINDGQVTFTSCMLPEKDNLDITYLLTDGEILINELTIAELTSIW